MKKTIGEQIKLRKRLSSDNNFLYELYAQTRQEELKITGWNDIQKEVFLKQQAEAQTKYWNEAYKTERFDVILWKSKPVGRFYVEEKKDELRLVDIILHKDAQGKGIGGYLIRQLLEEATDKQKPVTLHVEANNWAKKFYERLGFKVIKPHEVHSFLKWDCDPIKDS